MMPTHQIWSYHVTQEANFENFLFCPNSTFDIRKSYKIFSGKASTSEVISQKPQGGGITGGWFSTLPLVHLGLRSVHMIQFRSN